MTTSAEETGFRPALVIVDLQEDFCPPTGSLAVTDGRDVVPAINELLDLPFVLKITTKDWHPPDHISFASNHPAPDNIPFTSYAVVKNPLNSAETYNTRLWPVHCVQGTKGAQLIPELVQTKLDKIVEKGQDSRVEMYSAFTDPFKDPSVCHSDLSALLKAANISHVFVVGLAMDYCVKWTAIDSQREGFTTYVVAEGTRAVDQSEEALKSVRDDLEQAAVEVIHLNDSKLELVRAMGST